MGTFYETITKLRATSRPLRAVTPAVVEPPVFKDVKAAEAKPEAEAETKKAVIENDSAAGGKSESRDSTD